MEKAESVRKEKRTCVYYEEGTEEKGHVRRRKEGGCKEEGEK